MFSLAGKTLGEMMSVSNERLRVRSYFAAKVHGYEFHSVQVPAGIGIGNDPLAFDQEQMRAAFDAGYRLAKQPNPWSNEPPERVRYRKSMIHDPGAAPRIGNKCCRPLSRSRQWSVSIG